MNTHLLIFGILFILLGYLVGIKKQSWILSGFNEKRVKDKEKLARLVGSALFILGSLLVVGCFIWSGPAEYLLMGAVSIMLIILIYVNVRMVE